MPTAHETLLVYQRVTQIIWQRLGATFGIRTINAIAKNAIVRVAKVHRPLAALKVNADGLDWEPFMANLEGVPIDDVNIMLDELMDEFFEAIATLIGRLVINQIFVEAERSLKEEGDS
jgi:hypothetical protein